VLAPLLMMGAALGAGEAHVLPDPGAGFWPLVGMAAVMGGTMRAPFTATVFALELTHEFNMLAPVLVAVMASYALTVLVLRRSILTEKISRRGHHLSREYSLDPLEISLVRDSMHPQFSSLRLDATPVEMRASLVLDDQELISVVDDRSRLVSILRPLDLVRCVEGLVTLPELVEEQPVLSSLPCAYPTEPLRVVAHRMASQSVTRLPVLDPENGGIVGIITLEHLLAARGLRYEEETKRDGKLPLVRPRRYIERTHSLAGVRD
jgi:CIC family chloride channel protein